MTAREKNFHWASIFLLILHAAGDLPSPEKISPREYDLLYLQNPIALYRDTFVYSIPGDDSNFYHIVPKDVLRLKHHVSNGQSPRTTDSGNENSRHVIQNNVASREVAENRNRFTRREKVYPQYSMPYLKPILTTSSPYDNPWKPLRNDGSTFDIKISKSIKVSEPGKLKSHVDHIDEHSQYDSLPNEKLPSFHFNITFTHPEIEGVPENRNGRIAGKYHSLEYNHPVTPSWRPFSRPIYSQNGTPPPFRKSNRQDPRVLTDTYSNHKEALYRGSHAEDSRGRNVYGDNSDAQTSRTLHSFNARPTPPYDILFPDQVTTEFASEPPFTPSIFQRVAKNPDENLEKKKTRQNITLYNFTPIRKIMLKNNLNTSLERERNNGQSITGKKASYTTQPLFEHKISVSNESHKPKITYYSSVMDKGVSSQPVSSSSKPFNDRSFQSIAFNDSVSNILNKTISNAHFMYPSLKNDMETIQIARKTVPIFKVHIPTTPPAGSPNNHRSFTTKDGTFFEVNIPTNLFSPMLKKKVATFDDRLGSTVSSSSDLIHRENEPEIRDTEHKNIQRLPPSTPEVVTNKPPSTQKPKVKLTAGFLAGVLIAALVFLGFLIGTSIYAFHQWKYGKHRKNKKKTTNYSSEFLDDSFVGNTYLHNNIYLPTPQNIEEIASVDSDSFINGIEAITSDNYSSENSRNTTV